MTKYGDSSIHIVDSRRKIALEMLRNRFIAELSTTHQTDKIIGLFDELLCLAAKPNTAAVL